MLYVLVIAVAIAVGVFVANSKSRIKAAQLKNSYLKSYMTNEELFSQNDFLSIIFTQLENGNQVAAKDIKEAFDVMARMEASSQIT